MNARKLYTNAYRIYRNREAERLETFVETARAIGLVDNSTVKAIEAAAVSFENRTTVDPYDHWMTNTRLRVAAKPFTEMAEFIGKAFANALITMSTRSITDWSGNYIEVDRNDHDQP